MVFLTKNRREQHICYSIYVCYTSIVMTLSIYFFWNYSTLFFTARVFENSFIVTKTLKYYYLTLIFKMFACLSVDMVFGSHLLRIAVPARAWSCMPEHDRACPSMTVHARAWPCMRSPLGRPWWTVHWTQQDWLAASTLTWLDNNDKFIQIKHSQLRPVNQWFTRFTSTSRAAYTTSPNIKYSLLMWMTRPENHLKTTGMSHTLFTM